MQLRGAKQMTVVLAFALLIAGVYLLSSTTQASRTPSSKCFPILQTVATRRFIWPGVLLGVKLF